VYICTVLEQGWVFIFTMDAQGLGELIALLAKTSTCLSDSAMADCHRLSDLLLVTAQHEWRSIIATSPHDPVLTMYMRDGWGGDARSTATARSGAQLVLRGSKLRHAFLLQRSFLKNYSFDGNMATCMRVGEPQWPRLGPRGMAHFQATCDWEAIPRALGAEGITISCYGFDGCLFTPLGKHLASRHELCYSKAHGFDQGPLHDELCAMDWVCPVKCIALSCGNSVAWGLDGRGLT
jgi:hypothetical protein